ncbi:hypothetical protein Celaphus_00000410 [Cervus elaphus hippelaphus]|uniref:RIMS-binding protein 2 n=1 Tax=Cervus elaphus hippelaphus TaxID=46360 RepID=A0A212D939_CEREH|nr:hypothetical protein Celaphus_00000410 [Cervus elaphus hippelaphus]
MQAHMREAAERRQQLELEHEQALAILNAKQQEIDLLQKCKVRELEEKCRTQSEQFSLLSRDLEQFRQHAGKIDLLGSSPVASLDVPSSPSKSFPRFMNGLAPSIGKGQESALGSRTVVGEYIRPLPLPGDKPEPLSVKPTFLSRSSGPRCRFESDMDNDRNSNTAKQRYSGKVHLCVARYSYNPFDGPNENPEAELPLTAGKYLYVYGDMDEDGFYEGELLDGQRGLDQNFINHAGVGSEGENILDLHSPTLTDSGLADHGAGTLDVNIDDIGEDIVPYPRKITLIKQLAKSVIVGWEPPAVPPGWGTVNSYNVLVDAETRLSLALGGRTKALVEKLNMAACTYRISVQSVTSRGSSDELRCTLLVGKDVVVAPSHLRVDNITQISAQLSWLPTNSNYSHVIFLNEQELDVVRAARYKYQFCNLRPNMAYKVKVLAKPHQMPWQLPLEQRERKEAFVEFSTLPAGPPAPPQDVAVQAGATPATVQVSWRPPALTATGLSNGANVTGYGVYAKGQRVAEIISPTADCTAVELPLASAGAPETKDEHPGPHAVVDEAWEHGRAPAPAHGHLLEPPGLQGLGPGRRSPSPSRILPQPQGTPVSTSVAKAMAREAAQRVAESSRPHCCHGDDYHTESSRGSDLSDIMEEDEEELYSEMQLEDGGRRRPSGTSHNALKECSKNRTTERAFSELPEYPQQTHHTKRLFSIPEVAEEDGEPCEFLHKQALGSSSRVRTGLARDPRPARPCRGHEALHGSWYPTKLRGPQADDFVFEDRGCRFSRSATRSPDSGLDCGSEEEEMRFSFRSPTAQCSPGPGHCPCRRSLRPLLARRRTLTRQSSIEEDFGEPVEPGVVVRSDGPHPSPERSTPSKYGWDEPTGREDFRDAWKKSIKMPDSRAIARQAQPPPRVADGPLVRIFHIRAEGGGPTPRSDRQLEVYGDKDADGFYRGETCARLGLIPCNMVSEIQADDEEMMDQLLRQGFLPLNTPVEKIERNRRGGRQHSVSTRRMVALYDYDPRESSPNIDVEAELTFCTGDIITVFGEIDEDGFYYGELNGQKGLVPSNFLEEVPDDVEVYLSDAPSHYSQDMPMRSKTKRESWCFSSKHK